MSPSRSAPPGLPALAFCAGVLGTVYLPVLPPAAALPGLILLCLFLTLRRPTRGLAGLLAGVIYHTAVGQVLLDREVPPAWEGLPLRVQGQLIGLPQRLDYAPGEYRQVFDLRLESVRHQGRELPLARPVTVRLRWFGPPPLGPGQRWALWVELQAPRGLANPGGFDYRAWLLAGGISGTGKVLERAGNRLLASGDRPLDRLRARCRSRLDAVLAGSAVRPLVAALALGERQQLTARQREVMAITGTAHLFVISGLHIGLAALAGFALCYGLAGLIPAWVSSGRSLQLARLGGLATAAGYAALSGFGLPAQRALVMLAVGFLALLVGRGASPWRVLLLALVAVLLLDPLAGTAAGFWLSFGAVALLLVPTPRAAGPGLRWWGAGPQLRLLVGLSPGLAVWLGQLSLIAPLVNLWAVPVVGLCLVPLLLFALLLLPLGGVGESLLQLAAWLLERVWSLLEWLAGAAPDWVLPVVYPGPAALLLAVLACALFLAPPGLPGRSAWPLLMLPLCLPAPRDDGGFELVVLDVGQGTAVVVRAGGRVLVYDTGPVYRSGFDAGAAVLLPYLRSRGLGRIDRLVISHEDVDHSGGAAALLARLRVDLLMGPSPHSRRDAPYRPCRAGQRWRWGEVGFEIVHPVDPLPAQRNDRSCVLLIDSGRGRYLLAGDIGRRAERELAAREGPGLRAEVLLVPHHGSASSSSHDFTWFVRPRVAVVTAGYRNRFGHPSEVVRERYRQLGTELINTAETGALHFSGAAGYRPFRWFYTRYWQNYPCDLTASAQAPWSLALLALPGGPGKGCQPLSTAAVQRAFLW